MHIHAAKPLFGEGGKITKINNNCELPGETLGIYGKYIITHKYTRQIRPSGAIQTNGWPVVIDITTGCEIGIDAKTAHKSNINSVCMHNGQIISGCHTTIKIWAYFEGEGIWKEQHSFEAHSSAIYCLVPDAINNRLYSASDDGTIKIWNMTNWSLIYEFKKAGVEIITGLHITSEYIIVVGCGICVYDAVPFTWNYNPTPVRSNDTPGPTLTYTLVRKINDGWTDSSWTWNSVLSDNILAVALSNNQVILWDITTWNCLKKLSVNDAFSVHIMGGMLICGKQNATYPGLLEIYDLQSYELITHVATANPKQKREQSKNISGYVCYGIKSIGNILIINSGKDHIIVKPLVAWDDELPKFRECLTSVYDLDLAPNLLEGVMDYFKADTILED